LHQFDNILIYVLIGAAVITALLEHWVDTSVILAVVIINAIIGFIQEGKAEMAMDAIRNLKPRCCVTDIARLLKVRRWYLVISCC
jgi:magnesium-transporting ATPase (P-type)